MRCRCRIHLARRLPEPVSAQHGLAWLAEARPVVSRPAASMRSHSRPMADGEAANSAASLRTSRLPSASSIISNARCWAPGTAQPSSSTARSHAVRRIANPASSGAMSSRPHAVTRRKVAAHQAPILGFIACGNAVQLPAGTASSGNSREHGGPLVSGSMLFPSRCPGRSRENIRPVACYDPPISNPSSRSSPGCAGAPGARSASAIMNRPDCGRGRTPCAPRACIGSVAD